MEADGVLHFLDPWVIRPFRVSEVTSWQLCSILALMDSLSHSGSIMYLIIRVLWRGFEAVVKFAPQTFLELEGALCIRNSVFLFLQFGVVVGKLVEQNGDGHAVEDDAKRDATKCYTAAKIGDGDDIAIAHSRDAHLQDEKNKVSLHRCMIRCFSDRKAPHSKKLMCCFLGYYIFPYNSLVGKIIIRISLQRGWTDSHGGFYPIPQNAP